MRALDTSRGYYAQINTCKTRIYPKKKTLIPSEQRFRSSSGKRVAECVLAKLYNKVSFINISYALANTNYQ